MKLRRFPAAIDALTAASALRPTSPWPYYHLGVARLEVNDSAAAVADFGRYLELEPDDPDVADLDAAERHGSTRTRIFALREAAKRRRGDTAGADRDRKTFLEREPADALSWNVRGEYKRDSNPPDAAGALADFDAALKLVPDLLPALRNKANLLSEHPATHAKAIELLDHVLELAPDSVEDRAGRAVLLARVGRSAEALREVAACAPRAHGGMTLYQLASAALVAGDKTRGLSLLRAALRKDAALGSQMPDDPDLKLIHKDAEFANLLAAAATLSR
jgi:tetratricopeptide (TPR) repeat protein